MAAGDASEARRQLSSTLRRIRRAADLSQRELAARLGLSVGAVAQAETGERDLPASTLVRAARLAGLRLVLVDADGRVVAGMRDDAVRDAAGRRYPAHLDVRYGDQGWWHGEHRYAREQPWCTFDRDRYWRDRLRARAGAAEDHQEPRPDDSPAARAAARAEAARIERAEHAESARAARPRLGFPHPLDWSCTCPAACEELLLADPPVEPDPWHRPSVHVDDCPCGCDVS